MKHPQFIMAISAAYLKSIGFTQGMHRIDLGDFLAAAEGHVIIARREELEENKLYRQLLPYPVVLDQNGCVVPFRRLKGSGESKLHGKIGIGWGGHIDLASVEFDEEDSTIDLQDTVTKSMMRELDEELGVDCNTSDGCSYDEFDDLMQDGEARFRDDAYILIDNSDDVGLVHVAIVMFLEIDEDADSSEFHAKESQYLEVLTPISPVNLMASKLPLENWTRIILDHMLQEKIGN